MQGWAASAPAGAAGGCHSCSPVTPRSMQGRVAELLEVGRTIVACGARAPAAGTWSGTQKGPNRHALKARSAAAAGCVRARPGLARYGSSSGSPDRPRVQGPGRAPNPARLSASGRRAALSARANRAPSPRPTARPRAGAATRARAAFASERRRAPRRQRPAGAPRPRSPRLRPGAHGGLSTAPRCRTSLAALLCGAGALPRAAGKDERDRGDCPPWRGAGGRSAERKIAGPSYIAWVLRFTAWSQYIAYDI